MSVEVRILSLNTYDINISTSAVDYSTGDLTTSNGTVGGNFNFMSWRDVNLKTILGESYYNKYNKFSIKMLQCLVGDLTYTNISSQTNLPIEFNLEGLPFKNYNSTPYSLSNINSTVNVTIHTGLLSKLPSMSTLSSVVSGTKFTVEDPLTYIFAKPTADTVNLTIRCVNPSTKQYLNALGYGHFRFIFEIRGV
jgi:hypothetical protein